MFNAALGLYFFLYKLLSDNHGAMLKSFPVVQLIKQAAAAVYASLALQVGGWRPTFYHVCVQISMSVQILSHPGHCNTTSIGRSGLFLWFCCNLSELIGDNLHLELKEVSWMEAKCLQEPKTRSSCLLLELLVVQILISGVMYCRKSSADTQKTWSITNSRMLLESFNGSSVASCVFFSPKQNIYTD